MHAARVINSNTLFFSIETWSGGTWRQTTILACQDNAWATMGSNSVEWYPASTESPQTHCPTIGRVRGLLGTSEPCGAIEVGPCRVVARLVPQLTILRVPKPSGSASPGAGRASPLSRPPEVAPAVGQQPDGGAQPEFGLGDERRDDGLHIQLRDGHAEAAGAVPGRPSGSRKLKTAESVGRR